MSERGYVDAAPGRRTAAGALLIGGYNPSKLWVGGLPETATLADLEDCFGQIGPCSCTLKRGFGFVEYNDPTHAKEAVDRYNEGHFLGAQIKVELSLARAPESATSKGGSEPPSSNPFPLPLLGAPPSSKSGCFVCGSLDHWARECPDADKMPLRNPPGSDRPSDARKPMWINGSKGPRGGRNSGPPPPPMSRGPPPPGPNYPPRYDMPPFDRYNAGPPPPAYGNRGPDPYYGRAGPPPPLRDDYPPYAPPPMNAPFDRAPYPPPPSNGGPYPPPPLRNDPYSDRYGPPPPSGPPGRSPEMPPMPYGGRNGSIDSRPPYGAGPPPPLDPYSRGGPPPLGPPGFPHDGPAYDPREERVPSGGRYGPYPPRERERERERDRDRDDRGRPGSVYGERSPRMERRRSLSPRRGDRNGYGPPPSNGGDPYYSNHRPPLHPQNGYGRPMSPGPGPRYPPPLPNDPYPRR
ncbi:uncharacterized protein JCM6883_004131 [Sporobolomyces salmoneus]|uniref:uncharacterized protein n=1 Tax=Sporobolomyces salmoneus TaxID=183962 RepID=UPI003173CC19